MAIGTIIFVHGTGVRLNDYQSNFGRAAKIAAVCGVTQTFLPCAWGDPLGVQFEGKSLPDPLTPEQLQEEEKDFALWNWLFDDPLFELDKLTIRESVGGRTTQPHNLNPSNQPEWERLWTDIRGYKPSQELSLLLDRGDLVQFWPEAWSEVVEGSSIPRQAFQASPHELADVSHALSRALVAQMHILAEAAGQPGPNSMLRSKIVNRLTVDWHQHVLGLGNFLWKRVERAATRVLRRHRKSFSDGLALPIGDVLLYQSRGEQIREFIQTKIENARPPVILIAHSLGGIASFELLVRTTLTKVTHLVTVGSQCPLLYEIGALSTLRPPSPLPKGFPAWLNFYDRNDFLSYFAGRIFPPRDFELLRDPSFRRDFELESGQPFPSAHSAYFGNEVFWQKISKFIAL